MRVRPRHKKEREWGGVAAIQQIGKKKGRVPPIHPPTHPRTEQELSLRARRGRWAALQALGRVGVGELVDRMCGLSTELAGKLEGGEGVRVLFQGFNQCLVRIAGGDGVARAVVGTSSREGRSSSAPRLGRGC